VRKADVVVAFSSDALPGAKSKMNGHTVILADESLKDKAWKVSVSKWFMCPLNDGPEKSFTVLV